MRHVGAALAEKSMKKRKKHFVAIGIAPWGVVHKRQDLVGKDVSIGYSYRCSGYLLLGCCVNNIYNQIISSSLVHL